MLGILGGTSFLQTDIFSGKQFKTVSTPCGDADVIVDETVAMIPRHSKDGYLPPHRINHQAHLKTFEQLGVNRIVSFGSVGGLQKSIPPGTLMVCDDLFCPMKTVTFQHEKLRFVVPELPHGWCEEILAALHSAGLDPHAGGVYAETLGPRLETPAEVRFLTDYADVVGMTCASEAFLACELGIPLAVVAMVDNYANGIGAEPLTGKAFHEQVTRNEQKVLKALDVILKSFR